MFKDIKFLTRITRFIGRNGQMKCAGITLTKTAEKSVMLEPLTARGIKYGERGHCLVEIPNEDIPALIKTLQALCPQKV